MKLLACAFVAYVIGAPSYLFLVVVFTVFKYVAADQMPWRVVFLFPLAIVLALIVLFGTFKLLGDVVEGLRK